MHGLRVQKYPRTGYVFCNGEDRVPIPNDGKILDDPKQYCSLFTAVDGDTMKVAWQISVDGNLDNVDADYQGKYAWATCYNSEEGVTLAEMMAKEQDWVVIFNLEADRGGGEERASPRRSVACRCSTAATARPTPATFRCRTARMASTRRPTASISSPTASSRRP